MSTRVKLAIALAFVVGLPVLAVSTKFSDFIPLISSAPALPIDGSEEATPITLSNPKWSQRTVADRRTQNQLVLNSNSGSWDMITSNETGPSAGRYLFMPFETGTAGVQRVDLQNPNYEERTVTIVAPGEQGFVSGDASRWTPWGGYLTAEESWGSGSVKGRLFEVTNPITAAPNGGNFVWRSIVPRVSHEGLAFDENSTLYFVDELNGGSIYKYVSTQPDASTGDEYFAAGQTFVLKVGAGGQFEGNNGPAITGQATWVAITDATGGPIRACPQPCLTAPSTVASPPTITTSWQLATIARRIFSCRRWPTARSCCISRRQIPTSMPQAETAPVASTTSTSRPT
jgi:hypothetical protein